MEINVKKTKTMVISKTGNVPCSIAVNDIALEQVSQYKYLGSWITGWQVRNGHQNKNRHGKGCILEAHRTVEGTSIYRRRNEC